MKNIISFLTVSMMFFSFHAQAANIVNDKDNDDPKGVTEASFEQGELDLDNYFKDNLVYPTAARINDIEGEVTLSFFVLQDGTVHGARVVEGIDKMCDKAALEAVESMPKWKPAQRNGKAMASKKYIKVNFSLEI